MRGAFRLGSLFGIPFYIHFSWFLIFALISFSLSSYYFPSAYPNWNPLLWGFIGSATSLLIFASVVFHELAHSLVSLRYGIPVRSITLFIFGGIARIAREAGKPRVEFLIAFTGPLSSLVLSGFFWLIFNYLGPLNQQIEGISRWLFRVNLALALFNLIPGFPLDGGRVMRSLIWHFTGNFTLATNIASGVGAFVGGVFIGIGVALFFVLQGWFEGLWLSLVGFFLLHIALASRRQSLLMEKLRGIRAADIMNRNIPLIPPDINILTLVRDFILPTGRQAFIVAEGGEALGVIQLYNIKSIPEKLWETTPVFTAMTPLSNAKTSPPDEDIISVIEKFEDGKLELLPVMSGGVILGVIDRDELIRFIRLRSFLG